MFVESVDSLFVLIVFPFVFSPCSRFRRQVLTLTDAMISEIKSDICFGGVEKTLTWQSGGVLRKLFKMASSISDLKFLTYLGGSSLQEKNDDTCGDATRRVTRSNCDDVAFFYFLISVKQYL